MKIIETMKTMQTMKKIGIFGGTFNPVHIGHEKTAVDFYKKFDLSKLIVIPSNIPPHKQSDDIMAVISPEQRLEMCKIGFDSVNCLYREYNIEVSDIEIKKDGVSYSYDTIDALRHIYDGDLLYFLIGSDMFLYLKKWHRYRELMEMCTFVVAFRYNRYNRHNNYNSCNKNNQEYGEVMQMYDSLTDDGYKVELLDNIPLEISSTDLREMISAKDPDVVNFISPEVLNYIKERKIYVLQ